MAQALGIIDLIWKGRRIPVEKGATFMPPGLQNKSIDYGRGTAYSQENTKGMVSCTSIFVKGQKFVDLYDPVPGELQVQCDTGQNYVIPEAWMTDRPAVTGSEGGKVPLKWEFGTAEEVA